MENPTGEKGRSKTLQALYKAQSIRESTTRYSIAMKESVNIDEANLEFTYIPIIRPQLIMPA